MPSSLQQKLMNAFYVEQKEALERIRSNLLDIEKPNVQGAAARLEEAFRMAHSLKGASRIVELTEVTKLAHRLESLFTQIRQGKVNLDEEVLALIHVFLNSIEDNVAAIKSESTPAIISEAALAKIEKLLAVGKEELSSAPAAVSAKPPAVHAPSVADLSPAATAQFESAQAEQSLRLNASYLDRILLTAGELLMSGRAQDGVAHEYAGIERRAACILTDWKRMRGDPKEASKYLDAIEKELSLMSRELGRVRRKHQASSWEVKRLGNQLRDDVKKARMVSADSIFEGFHKMVRDLAGDEGKEVNFRFEGMRTEADRMVLQALKDPLMHLLRNALAHGIEAPADRAKLGKDAVGRVTVTIETVGGCLSITVQDDGKGIDAKSIGRAAVEQRVATESELAGQSEDSLLQLIFLPGFSTADHVTDISGRGMGLSVVYEILRRLKGDIALESKPGEGSKFTLSVPISIATHRVLRVRFQGQIYGIPDHGIERLKKVKASELRTIEGTTTIFLDKVPVRVVGLGELIGVSSVAVEMPDDQVSLVILKSGLKKLAVAVDAFIDEGEALIKELGTNALSRLNHVMGAMLLDDGAVSIVLNPIELIGSQKRLGGVTLLRAQAPAKKKSQLRILVVDDSFTTRTLEKSILEANGYHVTLAVDGMDALSQLKGNDFDLMISDVEMPRMDGFTLLEAVKKNAKFKKMPVIMVTSREDPVDKERGLVHGARAYLAKQKFDQGVLLETIKQII